MILARLGAGNDLHRIPFLLMHNTYYEERGLSRLLTADDAGRGRQLSATSPANVTN